MLFQVYVMAGVENDDVRDIREYRAHLLHLGRRLAAVLADHGYRSTTGELVDDSDHVVDIRPASSPDPPSRQDRTTPSRRICTLLMPHIGRFSR